MSLPPLLPSLSYLFLQTFSMKVIKSMIENIFAASVGQQEEYVEVLATFLNGNMTQ